jgi:hypothetical protein
MASNHFAQTVPRSYDSLEHSSAQQYYNEHFDKKWTDGHGMYERDIVKTSTYTAWDLLENSPDFSIWKEMVELSGYRTLLEDGDKSLTIFMVPDRIMFKLFPKTFYQMERISLRNIISYLILPGMNKIEDFKYTRSSYRTLHPWKSITIDGRSDHIRLSNRSLINNNKENNSFQPRITSGDKLTQNANVHIINMIPLIETP